MELRIRVNKNVEKGSDFCHRASSTFLEIRGQFSTTSTLRVSILNNEHRHLGSYFRPIRWCFRFPDFLGTDGRHLGIACRLLRYIVIIKRATLVCKRDLRWKRLWYESEKLRGQLANFRRHLCPIDFHTVDVFTSAIKGRYFAFMVRFGKFTGNTECYDWQRRKFRLLAFTTSRRFNYTDLPDTKSWSFNFACVVIGLPNLAPYIENTVYSIQTMFLVDDFKIVQFLLFLFTCEWGLGPN